MKLKELIRRFRSDATDTVEPYLWSDEAIKDWFSEAQDQACIRGRLLFEDSNDAVCRIALEPGKHTYRIHPSLYEVANVHLKCAGRSDSEPLRIVSRDWLEAEVNNWRNYSGPARWVVQGETTLRVVGCFGEGDYLQLEGYRLPMSRMNEGSCDEPEIHRASHQHLVYWVLHKAFSQPDADSNDPNRAANAEDAFTSYFGRLPDSDLRRETREDTPHTTMLILP
nr:hypothetical protein [uncultured Comamonas sp.]